MFAFNMKTTEPHSQVEQQKAKPSQGVAVNTDVARLGPW